MPGKILVVDDIATNRIILKVKLSSACYDVIQASGGQDALEMAQAEQPDLILMDLAMPGMNGIGVCRALKADPVTAAIPVIVITAYRDSATRLEALRAGAEEFLSRPFDDMELLARVRSLLRARGIAAELALREGTRRALGFGEPASGFSAPGRIALIGPDMATAHRWQGDLARYLPDRIEVMTRSIALSEASKPEAEATGPDVFLIACDQQSRGDGLMLLSELRSRQATRHSAIVMAMTSDSRSSVPMALDLGAADVVGLPMDCEETAHRLRTQLARKQEADLLRRRLRDGLQLAVTDPLTGLYNRRYAMSHLSRIHERTRSKGTHYALMLVDLDCFKMVNDHHGHAAGDHVLREVARRLGANLRGVDLIARIGGEEFLIVLPDITAFAAARTAERLRRKVGTEPIRLSAGAAALSPGSEELDLYQTVSIGLVISAERFSETELLAQADRALYLSKLSGRDQVTIQRAGRPAA